MQPARSRQEPPNPHSFPAVKSKPPISKTCLDLKTGRFASLNSFRSIDAGLDFISNSAVGCPVASRRSRSTLIAGVFSCPAANCGSHNVGAAVLWVFDTGMGRPTCPSDSGVCGLTERPTEPVPMAATSLIGALRLPGGAPSPNRPGRAMPCDVDICTGAISGSAVLRSVDTRLASVPPFKLFAEAWLKPQRIVGLVAGRWLESLAR